MPSPSEMLSVKPGECEQKYWEESLDNGSGENRSICGDVHKEILKC